jgi:hypothetical protein
VGDTDEIERLLAVMTAANPRVSSFVAIPRDPMGGSTAPGFRPR